MRELRYKNTWINIMILTQGWLSKLSFLSTIRITVISFFAVLALSACGGDSDEIKSEAVNEKTIVLSENGVGPINATTSFNMHQMTLAFSNYSVVEELNYQSGNPFPVIRVSEGVKTIMTIIPDASQKNIYSIIVEDNVISNSLGHHLGTIYSDVYSFGQTEDCQVGSQDMAGKVICYAPKTPNILYVFNGKKSNANVAIPPAEVLQNWVLESLIWRPKQ